ncbi:hypothetical protein BDN72DRAFT_849481, partial [Pluteus cervinus]
SDVRIALEPPTYKWRQHHFDNLLSQNVVCLVQGGLHRHLAMAANASSPDAAAAELAPLLPVLTVAWSMLMVYDHFITFDLEVERIWTLPWRLPKYLFLINRYIVPPTLFCAFVAKWTTWPTILSLGTVELMLILRVVALCRLSFLIGPFQSGSSVVLAELVAFMTLWVFIMKGTTGSPGGDLYGGCLYAAPSFFWLGWLPPVCFESVIIVLTIRKVLKFKAQTPPALNVLARDSLIYFLSMFSILLANLLIARFGRGFLGALLLVPSSVVACVGAARMTMNIREFTMSGPTGTISTGQELGSMNFRRPEISSGTTTLPNSHVDPTYTQRDAEPLPNHESKVPPNRGSSHGLSLETQLTTTDTMAGSRKEVKMEEGGLDHQYMEAGSSGSTTPVNPITTAVHRLAV